MYAIIYSGKLAWIVSSVSAIFISYGMDCLT